MTQGRISDPAVEDAAIEQLTVNPSAVVESSPVATHEAAEQGLYGPPGSLDEHGPGAAVVHTARVSIARRRLSERPSLPFTPQQLIRLDEALTFASRETGVGFSVYLGELGSDSRARAEELFGTLGVDAPGAVLLAVSPGERLVEIVTGTEVEPRVTDRAARLAVTAMVASFKEGDLAGGLVSALRMLADQAGRATR